MVSGQRDIVQVKTKESKRRVAHGLLLVWMIACERLWASVMAPCGAQHLDMRISVCVCVGGVACIGRVMGGQERACGRASTQVYKASRE